MIFILGPLKEYSCLEAIARPTEKTNMGFVIVFTTFDYHIFSTSPGLPGVTGKQFKLLKKMLKIFLLRRTCDKVEYHITGIGAGKYEALLPGKRANWRPSYSIFPLRLDFFQKTSF